MFKNLSRFAALAFVLSCSFAASSARATSLDTQSAPTGLWMTANHNAVIQIYACGEDICGRIAGLARSPGDPVATDWQGAPQCGLTIIRTTPADTNSWSGSILDPRDGSTYQAQITIDQPGQLKLRGYLGLPIFGETQTWTRYNGPTGPACQVPFGASS